MRILHINQIYKGLSTGKTVCELRETLENAGHKQIIAYSMGKKRIPHGYRIGGPIDHKIHALLSRITGLQGYFSMIQTLRFIHYIKKTKPDIVHLGNLHGNYIQLSLLLSFLGHHDIRTVVTLHDCWFYTGRCTHYTMNGCYQWKSICKKCPNENNTLKTWFFDRSKKMFIDKEKYFSKIKKLAIIGVSDWITNEAKESLFKNAAIIQRIYNWVDLKFFYPGDEMELRKTLDAGQKFIILSVASSFGSAKGLDDFIQLAKRLPPKEYLILLVGNIEKNIPLPEHVKNIPLITHIEWLAKLYRVSDVFISLSKEESFGKVLAEALACGTPIITYNMTACPEIVGEDCGYIAKNNTLDEILEGIRLIRTNTKNYYSEKCVAKAKENFNKEYNTLEYINIYKKLMNMK
ncbi:MAG: glycosyltransferase [Anaerocolumna sp.]